jgi:hypothetical protein
MKNMKKLSLVFGFLVLLGNVQAQEQQLPKEEFLFLSTSPVASLHPGETSKVALEIRRSKRYQKSVAELSIGSSLPAGITATYEESTGVLNTATLVLTANEQAVAGDYNLILNCTVNNKRKGVIVKVKIL